MKIPSFREFPGIDKTLEGVLKYLGNDLAQNLRDLGLILKKMTFSDNFECFETICTIEPTKELAIRNELRGGIIPSKRLIVRGDAYSPYIVDGDSEWTQTYVYMKNTHATQASTITILFLK